jgi:hypothetical protein
MSQWLSAPEGKPRDLEVQTLAIGLGSQFIGNGPNNK